MLRRSTKLNSIIKRKKIIISQIVHCIIFHCSFLFSRTSLHFLCERILNSHDFCDFFGRPTFCTGSIEALAEAWWNKGGDSLLTRLHQIRPITRDQMKNIPSETSPITKDPPLTQLYTYYVALLKIPNSELFTGNTPCQGLDNNKWFPPLGFGLLTSHNLHR